jgi:hypothetical protein
MAFSLSLARTQAICESVFESEHRRQRCSIQSSTSDLLPKGERKAMELEQKNLESAGLWRKNY